MLGSKKEIINQLQKDIFRLQGIKAPEIGMASAFGLGDIEQAFPNSVFPTGTIHEFLTFESETRAATGGFISGLLNILMQNKGVGVWIGTTCNVYPGALKLYGIEPDRLVFVKLQREKDILWVAEEALKCDGLSAVIAELNEMSFTQSRRLQLAVEQSNVTGFILRNNPLKLTASACAARWQVSPIPSQLEDELPGVGFPRWNVELLKVRNGNPGMWQIEWRVKEFVQVEQNAILYQEEVKVPAVKYETLPVETEIRKAG